MMLTLPSAYELGATRPRPRDHSICKSVGLGSWVFSGCTLTLVHVRMEANGGREPKAWPLAVAGSDAVAHVELHRLWRPMEVHRLWRLMELHRLWRLMELL